MVHKQFKSFKEQIKNLNDDQELHINNDSSYQRLLDYLTKFNMQKVIDGYNTPFFQNNDRTKKYRSNTDSDMILDFFDFENDISNLLIKSILKVEVRLNTSICYEILKQMNKYNFQSLYKLDYDKMTEIFDVNEQFLINKKSIRDLFKKDANPIKIRHANINTLDQTYLNQKIKILDDISTNQPTAPKEVKIKKILDNNTGSIFIKNEDSNYEIIQKIITSNRAEIYKSLNNWKNLNIQDLLLLHNLKEQSISNAKREKDIPNSLIWWRKTYRNESVEEMALYVISLTWEFGTTNEFIKYLNKTIKEEILKMYFTEINIIQIRTFILLLEILRILRNKISHGNTIYNIDYYELISNIYARLGKYKNYLDQYRDDILQTLKITHNNQKEIRLFQIIQILDIIVPEDKILQKFIAKILTFKEKVDQISYSYIKEKLGYYQND